MKHRKPEQVNNSVPAETAMPEFTLEEILQEFGSASSASVQDNPSSRSSEPVTPAEPQGTPSPATARKEPAARPEAAVTAPSEPSSRRKREAASTVEVPPHRPEKGRSQPEKSPQPAERQKPETRAPVRIEPQAPPATLQTLLQKYRGLLGRSPVRLGLTLFFCLLNFLLLCRDEFAPEVPSFLRPELSAYLSAFLLALSALLAFDVLLQGLRDLFRLRISPYTLGTLAVVLCIADAVLTKRSYCAAGGILLYFLFRSIVLRRRGMFQTLRTVCSIEKPMGICRISGMPEADSGLRCDTGDPAAFSAGLETPDAAQTLFCIYSTILLPATLAAALFFDRSGHAAFLHGWMLLLLGATPCAALLSFTSPFATLAKRLSDIHGGLCGWYGAEIFSGRHTIVLRDGDLFPASHITSNGMKLYGAHPAAKIIAYALAALEAAGSPLTELFESLLQAQYGKHYKAASHRFYDAGGIGAEIAGDIVLVGTLSFMKSMGVHMPSGTKVRLAVYVSVNGELAGIFALKYKPNRSTRMGLRAILSKSNLSVVLATRDFLITPELIAVKYEIPTQRLLFPGYTERLRYASAGLGGSVSQGALVARDTFGAFASTVAAGQSLRSATLVLTVLNLLAGFLGTILCALLLLWGATSAASPFHIALFQNLWLILSAFISFILLLF